MTLESTAPEGGVEPEAAPEANTEVVETEEREPVAETETIEETDGEEPIEEIEFDFGGNKLRVQKGSIPDDVAERLGEFTKGTWADYTRKSQDISEKSKSLEAREKAVERIVNINGEALQKYSQGLAVRQELEQLAKVDLQSLWQSNPDQARQVSDRIAQKQAEFNNIVQQVNQKETELTQAQQSETARRMEEGRQIMDRRIKGFSQKAPEVIQHVMDTYGLTKEQAETWPLNPVTAEMAYGDMMWRRMQATAKKPVVKPQVEAQPVTSIKTPARQSAQKDVGKMSASEMARYLGLPGR